MTKGRGASPPLPLHGGITMIMIDNWLSAVVQLFDNILRALLGEAFFSVLLHVLVLLVAFGLVRSLFQAGKKV